MTQENDLLLSRLAVRLRDDKDQQVVGSGILYYNTSLKDKVYVLTAAHNLFYDSDAFGNPRTQIAVDILDLANSSYQTLFHQVDFDLVSPHSDRDVAVLLLNKSDIESITGPLPNIYSVRERLTINTFSLKGFPRATQGKEIACLNPTWVQKMAEVDKFQLQLTADYIDWAIGGFSGSGVFLQANNQLYLFGIFTRFRKEEKGKVIYCQYLDSINEVLRKNYQPTISFTYLGEHGINQAFFTSHIDAAIKNLGPRFNEQLNFRLPISYQFNDLAKDNKFRNRVLTAVDKWLTSYRSGQNEQEHIADVESGYRVLREEVISWAQQVSWKADEIIEVGSIKTNLSSLNSKAEETRRKLFDLQYEEMKKNPKKEDDYGYREPFQSEINRMSEVQRYNYQFLDELDNISFALSNCPRLLIQGEAGHGKSHLLGDIAKERISRDQPSLLVLGQQFKNGSSAWLNILNQLGLSCTKDELLISLNKIGQQIGSRVLFIIDALNEGAGKQIWPHELAGFISDISRYPHIGLALTVRTSYYQSIVPENLRQTDQITQVVHEGFKGNEYAALRLFCEHYGLRQPNFPILSPEFTNPLLLRLLCEGVKKSRQNELPASFQSVHTIFNYYLKAVCEKLSQKREEYRHRHHIIRKAIQEMARVIFERNDTRGIPIQQAIELLDDRYSDYRYLLGDLLLEGIFIQNVVADRDNEEAEFVYFAYERLGDFYMAEELIRPYSTPHEAKQAFESESTLGNLHDEYWHRSGILEALAILLPEKYGLEIFEVYDWAFEIQSEYSGVGANSELNRCLLESLKWRGPLHIDNDKLTNWLRSDKFDVDNNSWLFILTELTARHDHPFNSDRLHRILSHYTMAERDSWWQWHICFYSGEDDYGSAHPLRRLIEWAWQTSTPNEVDTETARLVGQTLAWVLSSTNISLRDQTTKAMVNMLEQQPDALVAVLEAFEQIDDLYIKERLFGVAYGCALRTKENTSLQKIAQYVFDRIFKNGNPPTHILLRDYARNTVEYALYKKVPIEVDETLVRPPYGSLMPTDIPAEAEMSDYEADRNSPDFKQKFKGYHNQIRFSVMDWDFGRYEVDSTLRDFIPYSFRVDNEYKNFLKTLTRKQRDLVKMLEKSIELKHLSKKNGRRLFAIDKENRLKEMLDQVDKQIVYAKKVIGDQLGSAEVHYFFETVLPHIESKYEDSDTRLVTLDTAPIKRWIVKRVFDLGYNSEIHGQYESSISHLSEDLAKGRSKVERIGKKYQWIAFYEAVGMVADNYMRKEDRWSDKSKPTYLQGAWQGFLRDVDPVFITRNEKLEKEINSGSNGDFIDTKPGWWEKDTYDHWNTISSNWAETIEDLPDPKHSIIKVDEQQREWLYLSGHLSWQQPKPLGAERYDRDRKEITWWVRSYIVYKKDKKRIIDHLNQQNLWGRWLPESYSANSSLFNRENYWSPASKENEREKWSTLQDTKYKVMITTSEAVGELSKDKSGAHFHYEMPCKKIFEGMHLQYAPKDGDFTNQLGEVVVVNPDYKGPLIRKETFQQFLQEKKLDVIWTIMGKKNDVKGDYSDRTGSTFRTISGVYSFNDENFAGTLRLLHRE
jgi:hypothetical protein